MASEYYIGSTVRITAADLTHSDTGPVTTGATVTITLYDANDDIVSTNEAEVTGNDWSYDLASPLTAGIYTVKVEADALGVVWRDKMQLTYLPF